MNFTGDQPSPYYGALPTSPSDLSSYSLQAQAFSTATNNAYGANPDPQMMSQGLQANAGLQLAALANEGSPDFASLLSENPAGTGPNGLAITQPKAPPVWVGAPRMTTQDWNQYWDHVHNSDEGKSWGQFGQIPVANIDYANWVRGGDKQSVQKWQTMLQQKGFLQNKNELSGTWDASTEQAFDSFMIAKFLPDALYNKDSNVRGQTNLFLQSIGYDVGTVALTMGHDPKFKAQTVDDWLQTQGPQSNMRDSIGKYADTYGESTVPQEILDLKGGFFNSITDGVSSILHAPGSLLAMIPGVGKGLETGLNTVVNPVDEILSGNALFHPGDIEKSSTQAHSEHVAASLTDAEKQALQPAIQQIQQSTGFLHVLDAWSQFKTKLLLTGMFWLQDAFKGDMENPFDSHSDVATRADKYKDNAVAGIFGEQFAKDHSTLAALGNLTINMVDDPTTWLIPNIGVVGGLEKLGGDVGKITPVERLTNGLISHRAGTVRLASFGPTSLMSAMKSGDFLGRIGDTLATPIHQAQMDVVKALGNADFNAFDKAAILGGQNMEHFMGHMDKLDSLDEAGKLNYLRTTAPFADKFHESSFLANRREYMKILQPESLKGVGASKLGRLLHDLSGTHLNGPLNLNDLSGTHELLESALNASWHKGVDPTQYRSQINDVMNKLASAKSNVDRGAAAKEAEQLVEKNFTTNPDLLQKFGDADGILKAFKNFNLIGKDPKSASADTQLYAISDSAGKELSSVYNHIDKIQDPAIKEQQQGYLDQLHQNVVSAMSQASHLDPIKDAARLEDVKAKLNDVVAHYDQLLGGAGNKKPVAWFNDQQYQWQGFKYTPYDLVSFQHPTLRGMDWVQKKARTDKLINTWKSLVLSMPHSWFKMALGDESIRGAVNLLAHDPRQFSKYIGDVLTRKGVKLMPPTRYNIHSLAQDLSPHEFGVLSPGDHGYEQNLTHMFNDFMPGSGHAQAWAESVQKQLDLNTKKPIDYAGKKGVVADVKTWVTGDSPEAEQFRAMHNFSKTDKDAADYWSWQVNNFYSGVTGPLRRGDDNVLHQAMLNGQLDPKDVKNIMKSYKQDSLFYLPHIAGRVKAGDQGWFDSATDTLHHKYADHMIQKARSRVYWHKLESERNRMQQWYDGSDNRQRAFPGMTSDEVNNFIESEAQTRAYNWVRRNTYQMTRSMMGNAVRSVFPFWGAVANMDRFWLRTAREAPQTIAPVLYTAQAATDLEDKGGLKLQVPFAGNVMRMFGFTQGDNITFDPFHAMFLTAEGVNGFIPGLGPIASAPLKMASQYNPEFGNDVSNSALGQLAGLSYLNSNSPIQPGIEKLIDGASLAVFGKPILQGVPLVGTAPGYYDNLINKKLQQQEAQAAETGGKAPTVESAARDVGKQELATSPLSIAAPVGAQPMNERGTAISNALKEWDKAQTETDRQAIMKQYPDIQPYLQYIDPSTDQVQRQAILVEHPWVEPFTVGQTEATDSSGIAGAEQSVGAYDADLERGRLRHLTPQEYLQKINTYQENNQAWALYDNVQSEWLSYLQQSGQAANSPMAQKWRKTNVDPAIAQLALNYPTWGKTFAKQQASTAEGKFEATLPISSIMAHEVMPQNSWMETKATLLWRATLQYVSEAASAVRMVKLGGGSTAEANQVQTQLSQQLAQLATQDPAFKAQLSRYRFGKIEDLVNFEAETGGIGVAGMNYNRKLGL